MGALSGNMADYVKIAIDKYGITDKLEERQSSYILPDGGLINLDNKGHETLGDNMFSRYADALRIVTSPSAFAVDFMAEAVPTPAQIKRVIELAGGRELTFVVINVNDGEEVGKTCTSVGTMMAKLEEFYSIQW